MRIENVWTNDSNTRSYSYGMTFDLKHEDPKILWEKIETIIKETIEADKKKERLLKE